MQPKSFPSFQVVPRKSGTPSKGVPPERRINASGNTLELAARNELGVPGDRERLSDPELTIIVPLRTRSEMNLREHWSKRSRRMANHRAVAYLRLSAALMSVLPVPAIVTMVRIAPRQLDDDNLRGALKGVRDGVADAFGLDDRDPRIRWRYEQRRGNKMEYAVEIRIAGVTAGTALDEG